MKLNGKGPARLLTVILAFHITSIQTEASSDPEVLRVLTVGMGGSSSSSAADLLSGGKASAQQRREMEKTRPMMLVTGPNLCEEDADPQSFSSALLLSSPGPHAVLMLLNLEDPPAGKCDSVRQAQKLLGAEVLQFCIVLLLQNQQESFTGASRGTAGEMIRACGGRFHTISDSQPKPAQTAALVAEIEKLVWLNGGRFYSASKQKFKNEENNDDVNENKKNDKPGETLQWILLISLNAVFIFTKVGREHFYFGIIFFILMSFMAALRNILNPVVAIPLNLNLSSIFTTVTAYQDLANSRYRYRIVMFLLMIFTPSTVILAGVGLILGSFVSVRSWSDLLIVCYAAPGLTLGAHLCSLYSMIPNQMHRKKTLVFAFKLFLFCLVGVTLSMGIVAVFSLFSWETTILLLILGFSIAYYHLKTDSIKFLAFFLLFPCFFVCIGCLFSFLIQKIIFLLAVNY